MKVAAPEGVSEIDPRSVLPSHTRLSRPSATPGWAAIQPLRSASKASTSSCASSSRNMESEGVLPKSIPSNSLRACLCSFAKRSIPTREPWPLRIARIATSSIHHWGNRMPRRMRQSGKALRKLIRSVAAAGSAGWDDNGAERFPRTPP